MASSSRFIAEPLRQYILNHMTPEPVELKALYETTMKHPRSVMQSAPEVGRFIQLLVKLLGAKDILEIGTFTGYSSLWFASGLPEDGRLVTCDMVAETQAIGQPFWEEAGVAHKIDFRLGDANATLDDLIHAGEQFDMCFIDANKTAYPTYYEKAHQLVKPGGLIMVDNVLWSGDVIDESKNDKMTKAIRQLNEIIARDKRVESVIVPIGDGINLGFKKE